ncbi:MAG: hypothetical protein HY952_00580 [Elusimicrobia bacterium]|nr:hypothetical protein [Elusimicrobiota bacterium]
MLKILALLLVTAAPAAAQDASTSTYNEAPEEVVIKSASSDELRTKKPPLAVKADKFESIERSLEADKNLFKFESADFVSFSRNHPEKLQSARIIRPWRTSFSDKTVITFYPRRKFEEVFSRSYTEKNSKDLQWTLSITDEEGKIFHKYSGTGLPPEALSWSGENDAREWVRAGHSYAPVYVFVDEYGSPRTIIGELVKFTAIVYQKGGNLTISLDSAELFGPNKSARALEKLTGEPLLAATADLVKRRYYNMPLRVKVYAQTKDLADLQADLVNDYLKAALMSPDNLFAAEGQEDSYAQQRTDIVLLNK